MGHTIHKYPKGHFLELWTGIGIAVFSGIGIPLALITDNLALIGIGPAIGVAVGISIGESLEQKYLKEGKIRPMTEEEKEKGKILGLSALALLLLGILVFYLFYLFV